MPQRLTTFYAGECYHIYQRGGARQKIFFEEKNYLFFLRLLEKYLQHFNINIIAYCLLPNHFHILLRPKLSNNVSAFMGRLQQSYVQAINKAYKRKGPLFYERFRDKHVISERYEILLCRYIHINPVRHGVVNEVRDWQHSNYFEFVGIGSGRLHLAGYREKFFPTAEQYIEFVEAYGTEEDKELEQWLNL